MEAKIEDILVLVVSTGLLDVGSIVGVSLFVVAVLSEGEVLPLVVPLLRSGGTTSGSAS